MPYPGDDNIARCTWKDCPECKDIVAHFRGTAWRDHTLEQLWEHHSAISMFTPEALHYFLPAFMLQSLGYWKDFDEIPFSIACQFLPSKPDAGTDEQQYRAKRWAMFNREQREAIAGYLREFLTSGSPLVGAEVEQAISRLIAPPEGEEGRDACNPMSVMPLA